MREIAKQLHDDASCKYGINDESYVIHLDMVHLWVELNKKVFKNHMDYINTAMAAYSHDLIEDAQQTYNDIKKFTDKEVADITLAVTDIPAENRMLRFLSTVPKIIKDHRALILKLCDIGANSSYSLANESSMYKKYKSEWKYKRFIFISAAKWYPDKLNLNKFANLIQELDDIMDYQDY